MKALRKLMDRVGVPFAKGGPLERFYPAYEAADTFLFTPPYTTAGGPHVRDAIDQKRIMITVVLALIPCMLMAMFNTGYQAFLSVEQGGTLLGSWQAVAYGALGLEVSSTSVLGCMVYGALHFVPILLVTFAAGGACEVLFAVVRGHEVNEGLLVTGVLIPLSLPSLSLIHISEPTRPY